jgi:hypothetical protein
MQGSRHCIRETSKLAHTATGTTMKIWMRREQLFVRFAAIVVALMVAAAIALATLR